LVVLTPLGQDLVKADAPQRQQLFRQQISTVRLVQTVLDMLKRAGPVDRDDLLDHLALHLPNQETTRLLKTLLEWGRFADLIAYDEISQRVRLSQTEKP